MTVGILILAAGRATRFGADKRLARLAGGRSVIQAMLDQVRASGLPCLVCLGVNDTDLADRLGAESVRCIHCSRAAEGMGGTLAEGIGHIPGWDGAIIALADMPWVSPATYLKVAARLSTTDICVPVHGGRRGHPVGFGSDFYPELKSLGGETGARHLLSKYARQVIVLPVDDVAIHRDIDVPADLQ
ncbi:MAG: nucleotidyltransferase family protein [Halieaceae bacterium]|nr:nucleotidyltransferase family protein [Halieaceae bacterium]